LVSLFPYPVIPETALFALRKMRSYFLGSKLGLFGVEVRGEAIFDLAPAKNGEV